MGKKTWKFDYECKLATEKICQRKRDPCSWDNLLKIIEEDKWEFCFMWMFEDHWDLEVGYVADQIHLIRVHCWKRLLMLPALTTADRCSQESTAESLICAGNNKYTYILLSVYVNAHLVCIYIK